MCATRNSRVYYNAILNASQSQGTINASKQPPLVPLLLLFLIPTILSNFRPFPCCLAGCEEKDESLLHHSPCGKKKTQQLYWEKHQDGKYQQE